jgi:hypothetical protein
VARAVELTTRRGVPATPRPPLLRAEALEPRTLLALVPAGGEFRVNTYTPNIQLYPSIAADADGDFVVAWESSVQDGSGLGVYAQRYDADGNRRGAEFRVNATTFLRQSGASVDMDDAGNFVVAWQNHENDFEADVHVRAYSAAGAPLTGEVRANTVTAGNQSGASVAVAPAGNFVVAWTDSSGRDGDAGGIFARRFTAAGAADGPDFPVNNVTAGSQMGASVGVDAAGGFVVCWFAPVPGSTTDLTISARRFDASGAPRADEFLVATVRDASPSAQIAVARDGAFVVTWGTYALPGGVPTGDVYARRYNAAGVAQGGPFVVNSTLPGAQTNPSVAIDAAGDLLVAWTSYQGASGEADLFARRFNAAGVPQGDDFPVNSVTQGVQNECAVAVDADGDLVVAWHGNPPGSVSVDTYARLFRDVPPPAVTAVFLASSAWTAAFAAHLPGPAADATAFGYSVPAADQLATLPWDGLDRVSIRFSDDVIVARDDLLVRGTRGGDYPFADFTYAGDTRTATWTLGRAVRDDKLLLRLFAGVGGVTGTAPAAAQALDGEWTGNAGVPDAFPSGDGAPGGNFQFRLDVLGGDVNADRAVGAADLLQTRSRLAAAAAYSIRHDLNGSGTVDATDVALVRRQWASVLPAAEPAAPAARTLSRRAVPVTRTVLATPTG